MGVAWATAPWLLGALLGLSLAAPPGPMNALIARHSAKGGWLQGVQVGVAAPLADTLYLLVFAAGAGQALDRPLLLRSLAVVGAGIMLFFAHQAARVQDTGTPVRGFAQAFAVAILNPYQLGWWLTAGVVFVQGQGWQWVVGFLAGIFGWVGGFAWLIAHGARRWSWFTPLVRIFSTTVLLLFGIVLLVFGLTGASML